MVGTHSDAMSLMTGEGAVLVPVSLSKLNGEKALSSTPTSRGLEEQTET